MRLLTGPEMADLERWAAGRQKLSVEVLTQRAGAAVADRAAEMAPEGPIVIVAGKGNNGGDGRVAATLLAERGIPVTVVDVSDENAAGLSDELRSALDGAALIVDAVFGFSLHGAPRPPVDEAIAAIDRAAGRGAPVLAVDVPSGVEAHSGHVHGAAVHATETLALTAAKVGTALEPGRSHAGRVRVVDIGIDPARVAEAGAAFVPEPAGLRKLLPARPVDSHKKQCGRVLVVAGSQGMSGAACLTAEAALRSGAGTVHLAVPASLVGVVETKLTEAITVALPETFARSVGTAALDPVLETLPDFDVVALGPGLSVDQGTVTFVRTLIPAITIPLVLDADGLNAMVGSADLIGMRRATTVLTPHPGELARLAGTTTEELQHDRPGFARAAAKDWRATVVLKGAPSLVSDGTVLAVNPTGNPGMATMGAGDVLTGLVAGFMAQGLTAWDAAVLSTWVHGRAGDLAAKRLTQYCLLAGDILAAVPKVLKRLLEGRSDGCQ